MASGRALSQGVYAKNMFRCPAEWLRLVQGRSAAEAPAQEPREESEFLPERLKRRLQVVERPIDLSV
jgi:hypothetical protein